MHRGIPRASSHLGARGVFCGHLPSCGAKNFPSPTHTPAQLRSSPTHPSPPYAVPKIVPTRDQKDPTRANESQSLFDGNYAEMLGRKGTRWGFNGAFQTAAPLVQVDPQEKVGE